MIVAPKVCGWWWDIDRERNIVWWIKRFNLIQSCDSKVKGKGDIPGPDWCRRLKPQPCTWWMILKSVGSCYKVAKWNEFTSRQHIYQIPTFNCRENDSYFLQTRYPGSTSDISFSLFIILNARPWGCRKCIATKVSRQSYAVSDCTIR